MKYHEKFNEKQIKSVLKKLIIILLICVGIALTFPQLLKPNFEIALLFGLVITLILRLLDIFVIGKLFSDISMLSYLYFLLLFMYVLKE